MDQVDDLKIVILCDMLYGGRDRNFSEWHFLKMAFRGSETPQEARKTQKTVSHDFTTFPPLLNGVIVWIKRSDKICK